MPSSPDSPLAEEVRLLREMVEIESPSGREEALSSYLVDSMSRLGMSAFRDEVGNAVGTIGGGSVHLLFLGHIDTVPGKIDVRLEDGRLHGRGTVDAKGPLAAFISALGRVLAGERRTDFLRTRTITIVGAVEEEAASSKGAEFVVNRYSPDFVIVGEPSGWSAVTVGYKGRLLVRYRASQSARHTSAPGKSVAEGFVDFWNNVTSACKVYNSGKKAFETLDPTLRSVATESDGLTDRIEGLVSFRLPEGFRMEDLRWTVSSMASEGELHFYGEEDAVRVPRSTPLASAFVRAIHSAGGEPKFKVKTGTSDMNVVARTWRCPMVAYGPGDSSLDHTPIEHIELAEYGKAITVLEEVLRRV